MTTSRAHQWPQRRLGQVVSVIDYRGKSVPKSDRGIVLVTAGSVKNGYVDARRTEFVSEEDYDAWMDRGIPTRGDVLFTTEAPLGNCCPCPEGRVALGQRVVCLRPNKETIQTHTLLEYLISEKGRREITRRASGSTALGITTGELVRILVPIIPHEDQMAIERASQTWHSAIALATDVLDRARSRRKALMQQLLMGKRRFPGFSKKWDEMVFRDVFQERQIRNADSRIHNAITVGKYAIGRQSDKFNKSVTSENVSSYWVIAPGEFVYDPMSAYYGAIGRYDLGELGIVSPAYRVQTLKPGFVSDFIKFTVKSHYVQFQLETFSSQNNQVGKRRLLGRESFGEVSFPCPEEDEQKRIAAALNLADRELALLERLLAAYREQKRSLLQQLLTGKRRVKLASA